MRLFIIAAIIAYSCVYTLNNGVALKPPMGWNSWQLVRCETDCSAHPTTCLNEKLIVSIIDAIVAQGLNKHGYEYVTLGDCWASGRDESGRIQADPNRFPSGIKNLSDYAHTNKLKFGLLTSYSTKTCSGFVGSKGNEQKDADTFSSWGVDYVKVDACNTPVPELRNGYKLIGKSLNNTGRPMLYSCSWPVYEPSIEYKDASEICNTFRVYHDIDNSWGSASDIIQHWGDAQTRIIAENGPGHWVDPDYLTVGLQSSSMGIVEYKTVMSMWAMFAAPMMISYDLRTPNSEIIDILSNDEVIAVNQDSEGIAALMYFRTNKYEIWARPLKNGDTAVAIYNKGSETIDVNFDPHYAGVKFTNELVVRDLNLRKDIATLKPNQLHQIYGSIKYQ